MPHINEKLDFCIEVFVVHNKRVLLRLHDKYKIWLSVGGHIEIPSGEDMQQAAAREVKEEVGLDIKLWGKPAYSGELPSGQVELIVPAGMNRHPINDKHDHVALIYYASSVSDEVIPEKKSDIWRWCTKEDIDGLKDLRKDIAWHAKRAIDLVDVSR